MPQVDKLFRISHALHIQITEWETDEAGIGQLFGKLERHQGCFVGYLSFIYFLRTFRCV